MQIQRGKSFGRKLFPRGVQGLLEPDHGAEPNGDLSGFDALDVANIQFRQFRKLLLCHAFGNAFAADVVAQLFEPQRASFGFWHAQLFLTIVID